MLVLPQLIVSASGSATFPLSVLASVALELGNIILLFQLFLLEDSSVCQQYESQLAPESPLSDEKSLGLASVDSHVGTESDSSLDFLTPRMPVTPPPDTLSFLKDDRSSVAPVPPPMGPNPWSSRPPTELPDSVFLPQLSSRRREYMSRSSSRQSSATQGPSLPVSPRPAMPSLLNWNSTESTQQIRFSKREAQPPSDFVYQPPTIDHTLDLRIMASSDGKSLEPARPSWLGPLVTVLAEPRNSTDPSIHLARGRSLPAKKRKMENIKKFRGTMDYI
jgi:hypothetical protein